MNGSISGSSNMNGAVVTGCITIPTSLQTTNQTLKIKCENADYGADSFNCKMSCYAIAVN